MVVLPASVGPPKATRRPGSMLKETLSSAERLAPGTVLDSGEIGVVISWRQTLCLRLPLPEPVCCRRKTDHDPKPERGDRSGREEQADAT